MSFLTNLIVPFILIIIFRGGRPFTGSHVERFVGDIFYLVLGWIFMFSVF